MTNEDKVAGQQKTIDFWKNKYRNKSTLLFVCQTRGNGKDVRGMYDASISYVVNTIEKTTKKHEFDMSWYSVDLNENGMTEYYITASPKFYEKYETRDAVLNYIFSCATGLFGYAMSKKDAIN